MMADTSLRVPVGGVLTPRMERMIRLGSIGSAVVIAISAMVLSYSGLHDLALDAQIHPRLALLVPIMVDGLQFVGSLGVVYSTLSGLRAWYPWLLMLMGVSVSAWGNWQAAPDQLTAKLLHAAAPVILALVLEELLRVMRHKVSMHAEQERAAEAAEQERAAEAAEQAPEPEAVEGGPQVEPVAEPVTEPVTVSAPTLAPESEVAPEGAPVVEAQPEPRPTVQPPAAQVTEPVTEPAPAAVAAAATPPVPAQPSGGSVPTDDETLPPYPEDGTFKDQVRAILLADPDIQAAKIARLMNKEGSYTRKTVRIVRAELDEEAAIEASALSHTTAEPVAAMTPPAVATGAASNPPAAVVSHRTPGTQSVAERSTADLTGADPFAVAAPVGAGR